MNQVSQVLATLVHYQVAVRDTLEYCLRKPTYDIAIFKDKKRSVLIEVEEKTPLKNIIDNSGENGEKLEKAIREFYDTVYGDESTILKLATSAEGSEELRVDHNQHLPIYEGALPIHENVANMIRGIIADAHSKDLDCKQLEELAKAEERMYRGVAYMTLVSDLIRLFDEFNKAMQENKGVASPASNFIGKDIETVIRHINYVRANGRITDLVYKGMEDEINALVENMTGRRDLPAGKRFPDVMRSTQETIGRYVRDAEADFRAKYGPAMKELVESAQNNNGQTTAA